MSFGHIYGNMIRRGLYIYPFVTGYINGIIPGTTPFASCIISLHGISIV